MKQLTTGLLLAVLAGTLTQTASARGKADDARSDKAAASGARSTTGSTSGTASKEDARAMIQKWPQASQNAASQMLDRYGNPDVASDSLLVWKDKVPFSKIVVMRDGVRHSFPTEHMDVLTQEVALQVPIDKVADLSRFDGSLLIDRVKGTVASRSDSEANNIIALNLANDIIAGKRDVDSARHFYADAAAKAVSGKSSEYGDKLQFAVSSSPSGDPDSAMPSGSSESKWQSPSMTPTEPSNPSSPSSMPEQPAGETSPTQPR